MKKSPFILGLGALALMACGATLASRPIEVKAEGETSSEIIESTEVVESSEATESSEIVIDADGNGIPDAIEDYYDQHIREQYLFGISLGALVSFAASAFYHIWRISSEKKKNKKDSDEKEKQTYAISEYAKFHKEQGEKISEQGEKISELIQSNERLKEMYESASKALEEKQEKLTEAIEYTKGLEAKITTMLENQRILSQTKENIASGVADKIKDNMKGV